MTMMKLIVVFLGILLGTFACTHEPKIINPKDRLGLDKPVTNGYLNARDSSIQVFISRVLPFNKVVPLAGETIADATVEIRSARGGVVKVPFQKDRYLAKAGFQTEERVTLHVTIGAKTYSAATTIPATVQNIRYKYLGDKRVTFTWDGGDGKEKYYELQPVFNKQLEKIFFSIRDPETEYFASREKTVTVEGRYSTTDSALFEKKGLEFEFDIYALDSAMYFYQKNGLGNDIFDKTQISTAPAFSNFKDALGFFGSFNPTRFKTRIK